MVAKHRYSNGTSYFGCLNMRFICAIVQKCPVILFPMCLTWFRRDAALLAAGGAWARRFANLDAIKFCAAVDGACWYLMTGMAKPAQFRAGDILVMNGTR